MRKPEIKVRTIGTPDLNLAADLFAPLFLKINERNQANRTSPHIISSEQQVHINSRAALISAADDLVARTDDR